MKKIIPYLLIIPLTYFFMHFTATYMWYFDIGINQGMRAWAIYWIQTPVAVLAQVVALIVGSKFIENRRGRLAFQFAILFVTLCLVFAGFAMTSNGIPRQGGFPRFLGYYFLNLEPGQMPDGTWQ